MLSVATTQPALGRHCPIFLALLAGVGVGLKTWAYYRCGSLVAVCVAAAAPAADSAASRGDAGAGAETIKAVSSNALITVATGGLPIILSAPHGGRAALPGVPARKGCDPLTDSSSLFLTAE